MHLSNFSPVRYIGRMLAKAFRLLGRFSLSCVVLPILLIASSAAARGNTRARETQEKAAKKACITGDYQKGVDILGDLYVETNNLTYVYNQGRCFEQNHKWQEALDRFREYERKIPGGSPGLGEDVGKHIAECQSHLEAEKSAALVPTLPPEKTPPPAATPSAQASVPAATPAVEAASPPVDVLASPSVATDQHRGLRIAGYVVGAVGVASLATGVILNLKSRAITKGMYDPGRYSADKDSTRRTYETWSWVTYGIGAAGIVAGTTMVLLGMRESSAPPAATALLPHPIPGGFAITLEGGY
jgi:hypothetical protein